MRCVPIVSKKSYQKLSVECGSFTKSLLHKKSKAKFDIPQKAINVVYLIQGV